MNTTPGNDRWILRSRDLLERSTRELDASTIAKLGQARQAALAPLRTRIRSPRWPWMGGLVAAAAALALALGLGWMRTPLPDAPDLAAPNPRITTPVPAVPSDPTEQALSLPESDLDLIATEDEYLLLENLEFYSWLESAALERAALEMDDHEG
jgi:hypothetical protein